MKNVSSLQKVMFNHPSVGVATIIQNAIDFALEKKQITTGSVLTVEVLEHIRQEIYYIGESLPKDNPQLFLFITLTSKSKNPTEEALQYIEKLQRQLGTVEIDRLKL